MYLVSLVQRVCQRRFLSPRRLGSFLWSIAGNLGGQIELLRIFCLPAFRSLVLLDPVVPFRHHNPKFLFPGLSPNARAASVLHHYRFLISHLPKRLPLGATRVSADFFSLSFPIEGKPIEAVVTRHRSAAWKKRAVRYEVANRVCQTILEGGRRGASTQKFRVSCNLPEVRSSH
jgi:hypothetical protein